MKYSLYAKFALVMLCFCLLISVPSFTRAASTPSPTPARDIEGSDVGATIEAVVGSLRLVGYTSPNSVVTFLIGNSIAGTQLSCPGGDPLVCGSALPGYFDKTFTGIYPGTYEIGVYSTDTSSPTLATPTVNRVIVIFSGQAAQPDPLILPPTLKVDSPTLLRTESQTIRGMGRPSANVRANFNGNQTQTDTPIDTNGTWQITNPEVLHLGNNFVYSFVQGGSGAISQNSKILTFQVVMTADLNHDSWVDISDFSILMFNYGQSNPNYWAADINDDGFIDLSDFSIMMFNWNPNPINNPTPTPTPTDTPTPTP